MHAHRTHLQGLSWSRARQGAPAAAGRWLAARCSGRMGDLVEHLRQRTGSIGTNAKILLGYFQVLNAFAQLPSVDWPNNFKAFLAALNPGTAERDAVLAMLRIAKRAARSLEVSLQDRLAAAVRSLVVHEHPGRHTVLPSPATHLTSLEAGNTVSQIVLAPETVLQTL